jgi:hypothetical protein
VTRAAKQANADFALQRMNLLAERGLSDAKPFGCARHIALFRNGQEISNMPEFHAIYIKSISDRRDRYWTVYQRCDKMQLSRNARAKELIPEYIACRS